MTDPELLARLCDRQPDALMALYDRHGPCLFSLASWILRDEPNRETAAENVVATVFAEAWGHAAEIARASSSPRVWLTYRARQLALAGRTPAALVALDTASDAARRAIQGSLSLVPPLARPDQVEGVAVWLAFFEGLSVAEIGLHLKTGPRAASRALADGMRLLMSHVATTVD